MQQKVTKGMQQYYSSENLHPLNLPNIGVETEDKNNNMHIVESKNERIMHSKTNFMPVNKVNKRKVAKIPHPQFKKSIISIIIITIYLNIMISSIPIITTIIHLIKIF